MSESAARPAPTEEEELLAPLRSVKGGEGLHQLSEALVTQELPAFATTVQAVSAEAAREGSSVSDVARAILHDPSMTARLLKMANSSFYNPSGSPINTISRAIVVLGFNAVKSICLSISIMDHLLKGKVHRDRLLAELGRAYHAATQARALAVARREKSPEEVFIATLLYSVGRLAFWCFADKLAPEAAGQLDEAMRKPGTNLDKIERRVLGYSLRQLTAELNREWRLSSLLADALRGGSDDDRVRCIRLSQELARAAEQGWESEEMQLMIKRIGVSLKLEELELQEMLEENAREAALSLASLGIRNSARLVAVPERFRDEIPQSEGPIGGTSTAQRENFHHPQPKLVRSILDELDQMLEEKPDLAPLMELVEEGILRGVGVDRLVFGLLSSDRRQLRTKSTLGWDQYRLANDFNMPLQGLQKSLMDLVVASGKPFLVTSPPPAGLEPLISPPIRRVAGESPFMVAPVRVGSKVIGIFYTDRRPSRRPLGTDDFERFTALVECASRGLSRLYA